MDFSPQGFSFHPVWRTGCGVSSSPPPHAVCTCCQIVGAPRPGGLAGGSGRRCWSVLRGVRTLQAESPKGWGGCSSAPVTEDASSRVFSGQQGNRLSGLFSSRH